MHASILVLTALVAAAAGQYPFITPAGVPLDTPEVHNAKVAHSIAWTNAALRSSPVVYLGRKRRDAPLEQPQVDSENSDAQPEKRQIIWNSWAGRTIYPATYPAYYPTYPRIIIHKRDSAADESQPDVTSQMDNAFHGQPEKREVQDGQEAGKEKRQVIYSSLGYGYTPYVSAYPAYPYSSIWYKKRDTAEATAGASRERRDVSSSEEPTNKDKRQVFYSGLGAYGYTPYVSAYPGYPYAPFLYKKRDTSEATADTSRVRRSAPSQEEEETVSTNPDDTRSKRQIYYSALPHVTYAHVPAIPITSWSSLHWY